MKFKNLFILEYFASIFYLMMVATQCTSDKVDEKVTDVKDYQAYLNVDKNLSLDVAKSEYDFWKTKLDKTPNQYPYYAKLASANTQIFKTTGTIKNLKEAEQHLIIANEKTNFSNANYLRSLSRNYISQHRFKEALSLLQKAEINGQNLTQTHLMLVDVYLELGSLPKAEAYLSKVKNLKSFDYLIRLSKYNDHIGNIEAAIHYLEAALEIAISSKKESLLEWNYTNLADYYGHAGRIKDSYNAYLKALEINPNNSYAQKGIAWIVFSYERNPEEALTILDAITKENTSPDYFLLKSEIYDFMGNIVEKKKNLAHYYEAVKNEDYGVMYAKYNVLLFAEQENTKTLALDIAKQEVLERPTPQSYSLLAWATYKNDNLKKAVEIVENYVLGKTFEPEILLHSAQILKAVGKQQAAKKLKVELLGAVYELGPNAAQEIKSI